MSYTKKLSKVVIELEFPGALDDDKSLSTPCPVCGNRKTESCYSPIVIGPGRPSLVVSERFNEETPPSVVYEQEYPEPEFPFGTIGPKESIWDMILSALTVDIHGEPRTGLTADALSSLILADPQDFESVISANLATGRLVKSDTGILSYHREFDLDKALHTMWWMTTHGEAPRSGDRELRKLVSSQCLDSIMDDSTFVLGPILDRFDLGCMGVSE